MILTLFGENILSRNALDLEHNKKTQCIILKDLVAAFEMKFGILLIKMILRSSENNVLVEKILT